jgi:hypothetical protein
MGAATATRSRNGARRRAFRSAREMREVLDRTFAKLNEDDRAGPLLRAMGLNLGVECPDVRARVLVAASERPDAWIEWSFDPDPDWDPTFLLAMNSEVANRWLQGRESVAMAIAHRRMKCIGDARSALRYLPAVKLISAPYKRIVRAGYPHLAL